MQETKSKKSENNKNAVSKVIPQYDITRYTSMGIAQPHEVVTQTCCFGYLPIKLADKVDTQFVAQRQRSIVMTCELIVSFWA